MTATWRIKTRRLPLRRREYRAICQSPNGEVVTVTPGWLFNKADALRAVEVAQGAEVRGE